MTTCGMPCSRFAVKPAKLAYHVCECTRSAPAASPAISRSTPIVPSAALRAVELGGRRVAERARLVARGAEAAHHDVEIAPERPHEFRDVHPGSSVDLGRVFAGEQVDAHAATLAQRHPTWSDFDARNGPRLTTLVGMATRKIFGIVLAGGEGKRLMPLTEDRAKPAVPFGGQYRLIDFALSNLLNSGLRQIVVLTQYKSHSLDRHVSQTWRMNGLLNSYVASVPAQQRLGKRWFSGSADAILQSLNLIYDEQPDIIVVVGADHVYRMDFSQMIEAHIESGAGGDRRRDPAADLARRPVRRDRGRRRATRTASTASSRSRRTPWACPTPRSEVLASMGNYVFNADALIDAVLRDGERTDSSHDMGGDIIPAFVGAGQCRRLRPASATRCPGSTDRDRYYWRDVGTIDSFFEAHQDLISVLPVFNLYNREWPIFSQQLNSPPAKFTRDARGSLGTVIDSIVSLGSVISGAHVERSVLGPWAIVGSGAHVADSILFDRARIDAGATVQRAILDKEVVVEAGARIGVDRAEDLARGFIVTDSGITVVGKGSRVRANA